MSLLMLILLVLLVAGPGSAQENATEESPLEPSWVCDQVSVQSNITMEQVLGEWILLEVEDESSISLEDVCLKFSFADLRDDDANSRSSVNMTVFRDRRKQNFSVSFPRHRPWEILVNELRAVLRFHSLSSDGHVLVMAVCNVRGNLCWMTLGVGEDSLPPSRRPQRTPFSARRDANVCQQQ